MNALSMLVMLLQTSVVLGIALAATVVAQRTPVLRLAVGRVAIVAAIMLAAASPWVRQRAHPVVPVQWEPAVVSVPVAQAKQATVASSEREAPRVVAAQVVSTPIDWEGIAVWTWIVGIVVLWAHLVVGYRALARVRRECQPVVDPVLVRALGELAAATGIRTPRLLEGDSVDNPFVAGVRKPTVFLPTGWRPSVDDEAARAIIQHELAHIANGDLRWGLFHRLACIALWPQPLLWLLAKPMAAASEDLCDRQVLASGISDVRYADCLLKLREGVRARPCPSLGIGAASSKSSLARRIEAILDRRRSKEVSVSRPAILLTRGGIGLAAVAGVFVFAVPQDGGSTIPDPYAGWVKAPYVGRVKLITSEGKPAKDASAWLQVSGDEPPPVLHELAVSDGEVVLPGGSASAHANGTLLVKVPGQAFDFVRLWPVRTRVTELRLGRPTSVKGRLVLPSGSPAAGVQIRATVLVRSTVPSHVPSYVVMPSSGEPRLETRTDQNGAFTLSGLPDRTVVQLDVDDDRFAMLDYTTRIEAKSDGSPSRDIRLAPACQIAGRVLHGSDPVAGVRIVAQGNHVLDPNGVTTDSEATTGVDGTYVVKRLPKGIYNVVVYPNDKPHRELTAAAREGVALTPGTTVGGIDFELIPGAVVQGRVTYGNGKPIADVYVGIYGPANPRSSGCVQSAFTDADGRYELRVPAGKQYLYVGDSRFERQERQLDVPDGATDSEDFVVKRAAPELPAMDAAAVVAPGKREFRSAPPAASFGHGAPFYGPAKLKSGAIVRLAYLQDDKSAPHNVWNPDGSPATSQQVRDSLNMHGFVNGRASDRVVFANVLIDSVPPGSYDCEVQVPHKSSRNVWQGYGDGSGKSLSLASFHAPESLKVSDMRFGVAAAPFSVVAKGRLGEAPLYASINDGRTEPPATLAGDESVSIRVCIPQELEGKDIHLAAYTRDGRSLDLASWQTETQRDGPGKPWTRSFGFGGGSAKDVYRVELLARDYEWVTFRGLHLFPASAPVERP